MGYYFFEYTLLFVKKSIGTKEQEALLSLLVEQREKKGLLQTELASRLGKPQSFISKYENGERRLDVLELRQVCHAIGISLPAFIKLLEKKIE